MERRQKGKKIAASDGIQECIENIQDIRANNQRPDYLKKLDRKIMDVESITVKLELLNGTLVTSAQMILKIGMATTVLVGASFSFWLYNRLYDLSDVHAGCDQAVPAAERLPSEPVCRIFHAACCGEDEDN